MARVFRPKYKYVKADGTRVEKITEAWYIEYADAGGRWIRRKAGITKEQAKDALRQAEADVLSEKNGLPTQRATEMRISDLLSEYITSLRQRSVPDHVKGTKRYIEKLVHWTRAVYLRDLKPEKLDAYMAMQVSQGLAPRHVNSTLIAVKAMLNWAVTMRKLPYNPLACIKRMTGAPRRRRRALTEDEIRRLINAALSGPTRRGLRSRRNRPRKDGTYKVVVLPPLVAARLKREGRVRAGRVPLNVEN